MNKLVRKINKTIILLDIFSKLAVTINKIIISAQKNSLSLYDTIKRHRELNIPFSNSVSLKLQNFVDLIEVFKIENEKLNAFDLTKELLNKVKIITFTEYVLEFF